MAFDYDKLKYYYVEQDYNGLWFVLNENGFPISQAFASRGEADLELKRLQKYD